MLILPKDIKNLKTCNRCNKQRLSKDITNDICVLCRFKYSKKTKLYYYRLSLPL